MKSSFNSECGKDCGLQYLNILTLTSIRDKNSSITQNTREKTTLDIFRNILDKTKQRLSMDIKDPANTLDNLQRLEDDESYLMGSVLDNLLISKREDSKSESKSESNTESMERYKDIKSSGEDLAQMLTKSMSPMQPPRTFKGTAMQITARKGFNEIENTLLGEVLEFTTTNNSESKTPVNKILEESNLLDLNLIEWDPSVYNFNRKERNNIVSTKIGTYNIYNEDQTTKIVNKTIEFKTNVNFTGMNETQVNYINCTYYDENNKNFSTAGIQVIQRNVPDGYLLCNSTHLSDFGAANVQNETVTVLTNANFEESTNFSELQEYKFYESTRNYIHNIYI